MRVDGNAPSFAGFETSVTFADPMLQLQAESMAEEQSQMMADSAAEMKARAEKQRANEEAVEAMRDQANAIQAGGLASGGALIVGGGLESLGAGKGSQDAARWGQSETKMAEPLNQVVGQAPAKKAEADATQSRNSAEQKQWNIDDAKERRQRAEKQQENTRTQLNQEVQAQRETTSFLLQRM